MSPLEWRECEPAPEPSPPPGGWRKPNCTFESHRWALEVEDGRPSLACADPCDPSLFDPAGLTPVCLVDWLAEDLILDIPVARRVRLLLRGAARMTLPPGVLLARGGDLQVPDPDTGEVLSIRDASDHALATAAREIADLDRQLFDAKRALAAELRDRHGVGVVHAGGHAFTVAEAQSWPAGATKDALARLIEWGEITQADADRAMPAKPAPDKRAIKALISRLVGTDPSAAQVLADAGTVSPASVRDVRVEAVDEEAVG